MKRIIITFFLLIIPFIYVNAGELKEYDIIDCKVFIDSSKWGIVSQDDATDEFKTLMKNNNLYLYAEEPQKESLKFEMIVNKTDNVSNMNTFTDAQMKESMDAVRNAEAYKGKIKNVSTYEVNNYKFIIAEYDDSGYAFKSYATIINGNTYSFKVYRLKELSSSDENELLNIINKLEFKLDSYYENSNNFSNSSSLFDKFLVGAISAGIIIGLSSLFNKNKKKDGSDKKEEIKEIKEDKESKEEIKEKSKKPKEESKDNLEQNKVEEEEQQQYCDNCGAKVREEDTKCPKCGALFDEEDEDIVEESASKEEQQEEMFKCDNCGAIVKGTAKKCPKCGETFEDEENDDSDVDKKYKDLNKLKELLDKKIITKEEFEKEKKKVLK